MRVLGTCVGLLFIVTVMLPAGSPIQSSPEVEIGSPPDAADEPVRITIAGSSFASVFVSPVVQIDAGDLVVWENAGLVFGHTATDPDGGFDTGVLAPGASSAPIAFPEPGLFVYECAIHPQTMRAVLSVA